MEQQDEELIAALLPHNPELKAAYEEHARLNVEVDKLAAKPFLSPAEEIERKNLQKRKLAEKTRIVRILDEYRRSQASGQSG
jgi:hypothetical protein